MTPTDDSNDDALARQMRRAVRALPDAPLSLQRRAIALWPQAGALDAVGMAVRRILAPLSFDSWAAPAPSLAMRSAASSTRHLLFTAPGRDVDLRVAAARAGFTLSGQMLGPDESGATVELQDEPASQPPVRVALDDLGAFRFDGVPRGTYRLTLRVGAEQIELPPLDIGEPAR